MHGNWQRCLKLLKLWKTSPVLSEISRRWSQCLSSPSIIAFKCTKPLRRCACFKSFQKKQSFLGRNNSFQQWKQLINKSIPFGNSQIYVWSAIASYSCSMFLSGSFRSFSRVSGLVQSTIKRSMSSNWSIDFMREFAFSFLFWFSIYTLPHSYDVHFSHVFPGISWIEEGQLQDLKESRGTWCPANVTFNWLLWREVRSLNQGFAVTGRVAKYFSALRNLETYTGFFLKNSGALLHLSLATCRLPKTDPWRE